jgi:hypothetical protein
MESGYSSGNRSSPILHSRKPEAKLIGVYDEKTTCRQDNIRPGKEDLQGERASLCPPEILATGSCGFR